MIKKLINAGLKEYLSEPNDYNKGYVCTNATAAYQYNVSQTAANSNSLPTNE